MDEINVTPLIDIVLVLLIIFMVLTPITMKTMASQLPPVDEDEEPPPPDQPPDQLMVAIYKDGTLALNLESMTDEELDKTLKRRLFAKAKKTVFIDADPNANYARVIEIMDMARNDGADKIGFADLKDEGPTPPIDPSQVPAPLPEGAAAAPG
jgi:biopolymer transport protein ExbD